MNPTIIGLEISRQFREYIGLFFMVVLPAFFFIIFAVAMDFGNAEMGNGNQRMYSMVSMAAYGAVVATASIGSQAAVERMQGWGRQIGITPLPDASYVGAKTVVSVAITVLPIGIIYLLGVLTGAEGTATAWALTALLSIAGAVMFALWGLVWGLAIRSEAATAVAGASTVVLAFLGNLFMPLSGTLLAIAKFTPLYGYAALARYPITEGWLPQIDGEMVHEPIWIPLLNVASWTTVLAIIAVLLVRRSRGRQ